MLRQGNAYRVGSKLDGLGKDLRSAHARQPLVTDDDGNVLLGENLQSSRTVSREVEVAARRE